MATAAQVFRDYVTDGVPSSGARKPKKSEIRTLLGGYEIRLNAADLGGAIWKGTKALLAADLAHAAGNLAVVYDDATSANNGLYVKVGASATGSWSQITTFLPGYQFVTATDDGSSTANAYTMDTNPRLPFGDGVALIEFVVPATNTSATVTVSFDGDAPLTIKTASGNAPASGGLVEGMPVSGVKIGSSFFMRSDQASAALLAQAEAAAAEAEGYKDQAAAYADFARNNWAIAARFMGTGSESDFPLSVDPGSENNMFVSVGPTIQPPGGDNPPWLLVYDSGDPFIRVNAPDDAEVVVRVSNAIPVGTPPDGSVTEPKLGSGAVTGPKLAGGSVSTSKLADKATTYQKMQDVSATLRLIGRKTAGSGPPEEVSPEDLRAFLPAGTVIETKFAFYSSHVALKTVIPFDDTPPQSTEGTQILSVTITPKAATNLLRVRFQGDANAEAGSILAWSIFLDGVNICAGYGVAETTGSPVKIGGEFVMAAGTTNAVTITVRAGPESNTKNMYFNGPPSSRIFGGASVATLSVDEVKG